MMRRSARMPRLRELLSIISFAVCSSPAWAQESPEPEPTRVDDIVVSGTPLREQVDDFVGSVTAPPTGRGPARWSRRGGVCIGVANLAPETAQAIVDRMSEVAADMGLTVGDPGCRANVLVIATDDAPALTSALVERSPNAFRPDYAGSSKSRQELRRFVETDRPIRWWHVSMPVISGQGIPAVRMPGDETPVYIPGAGRTRTAVRNVLLRAYVIIDLDQVETLSLVQLADYSAMVAFAQIDPDADVVQFPTILNVLVDPGGVSELTDWDRAYLGAVYGGGERNQRSPASQIDSIGTAMFRDRNRAVADDVQD